MGIGGMYIGLFLLGVVYALATFALGWMGDLGGHGDVHVDASGHLDAGHPSPLSGTVIATFITGFGGAGILAHHVLAWPLLPGIGLALAGGLVMGGAAFLLLDVLFRHTEAGSEFDLAEATGLDGEVITTIPAGGTGEVAVVLRGQRESVPARSLEGEVTHGAIVHVERVMGNTLFVRPKP